MQTHVVRLGPSGAIGEVAAEQLPVTTTPPAASASTETVITGLAIVESPYVLSCVVVELVCFEVR